MASLSFANISTCSCCKFGDMVALQKPREVTAIAPISSLYDQISTTRVHMVMNERLWELANYPSVVKMTGECDKG